MRLRLSIYRQVETRIPRLPRMTPQVNPRRISIYINLSGSSSRQTLLQSGTRGHETDRPFHQPNWILNRSVRWMALRNLPESILLFLGRVSREQYKSRLCSELRHQSVFPRFHSLRSHFYPTRAGLYLANSLFLNTMKTTILFCLLGTTLAAPTKTIEDRQLGNLGSGSGLGALSSLLPGIGNLGSGVGGSSGSGLSLPNIPGLGNLGSGLGGSSGGGLSLPSFSNTPSLGNLGGFNGNAKRQTIGGGSSTANGVTDNESCQPLTFIFARGTGEMGNMGSVVGPPVASQLKTLTGDKVVVQGVDYPASAAV